MSRNRTQIAKQGHPSVSVCPFGEEYIDECGADCRCLEEGYACTVTGSCMGGKTAGKPMACEPSDKLPVRQNRRVFCHENVVKVQHESELAGRGISSSCAIAESCQSSHLFAI